VRARPPKLLIIDGPGTHNGYILYHNDCKAGRQAEEDPGSIRADNYTTIPRTAPAQSQAGLAIAGDATSGLARGLIGYRLMLRNSNLCVESRGALANG
jgi:hypothetical protein